MSRGTMIHRPFKTDPIKVDGGRTPRMARLRQSPTPSAAPPSKAVSVQPAKGRNKVPSDRMWGG